MTFEPFHDVLSGQILAIVRTSDVGWPSHLGPILSDLFDLTSAEIEVAKLMVEGARVKDIAERRLISVATVRSQLHAIFVKTETENQLDCVRLIFGLSLMHDRKEGRLIAERIQKTLETPYYPRDDQRHLLELSDGRVLEYADFGAPGGQAVLFYHCEVSGEVWFRDAVRTASRLGLRIIAPMRPGFGRSTPFSDLTNDPVRCGEDARALLDALGIRRAAIFGVSCALLPALGTAHAMPDRIVSVTVTRPYFPVAAEAELEGFTGYTALVQQARLRFPLALRFIVKAGFAFTANAGPVSFAKSLMRASPEDVAWVTRSDISGFARYALSTHKHQGHLGLYSDLNYSGPWRDLLRKAPCPFRFASGAHDSNVQWGETKNWAEELPHARLERLPNSGYMVPHQHADQILKWLRSDLAGDAVGR